MAIFETEQEQFWAGEFGDQYISRNRGDEFVARRIIFFSRVLQHTAGIDSFIEYGANIGTNLRALKQIFPKASMSAIEINQKASERLRELDYVEVYNQSVLTFEPTNKYDCVLTMGFLIHVEPRRLEAVYRKIYESSNKYIFISEYYNPEPVEVCYQGYKERLYKRDFAGDFLDTYPDLKLIDYGFFYHRDIHCPEDDANWFLLEKKGKDQS